jgi:hypothetical protein
MSSALLCAVAKAADVQQLDILIDAGAILDVVEQRCYSALMCAAENTAGVDAARLLVDVGVDVNYAAVRVVLLVVFYAIYVKRRVRLWILAVLHVSVAWFVVATANNANHCVARCCP